jgi:hypothetical protein
VTSPPHYRLTSRNRQTGSDILGCSDGRQVDERRPRLQASAAHFVREAAARRAALGYPSQLPATVGEGKRMLIRRTV